jgi:hypothetical protein
MTTMAPLAAAAAGRARQARVTARGAKSMKLRRMDGKQPRTSRRRWPMLGLLAAGAAVGTAMAMRRRKQQQWAEYDPARPLQPMSADMSMDRPMQGGPGAMKSPAETAKDKASAAGESLSSAAKSMKDSAKSGTENVKSAADRAKQGTEKPAGKATNVMSNTSPSRGEPQS